MAQQRTSNPAFRHGFETLAPGATATPEQLQQMYASPPTERLTVDDVVMHTLGLLALVAATGVVGWLIAPSSPGVGFAAGIAALALSLFIAFRRVMKPALVVAFAVLEGLAIGVISHFYEDRFNGIVLQALLGTGLIFVIMLGLYRSRRLRATPRMARIVSSVLIGVVALGIIDLVVRSTTGSHLPIINDASPLGILFSLAVLVVASLQFILDFDFIERAVRSGAPRSEAWRASYGLLIGFVWVYLELLRLLGKIRS